MTDKEKIEYLKTLLKERQEMLEYAIEQRSMLIRAMGADPDEYWVSMASLRKLIASRMEGFKSEAIS